jgi:hypothetical protein
LIVVIGRRRQVAEIQGVADELPALLLRLKTLEAVHQEVRWLIVVKGGM